MKQQFRKLLSLLLSLTLALTLTPAAFASEALGDDLAAHTTALGSGTELAEGTFWSNTYSDLRRENYIVYTPNETVTPIVTYGDYVTEKSTVAAMAKRLEAQGLRVVAGINGDYYGVNNGVPMGTTMTQGVLRNATAGNYAVGFRADGTAILGAPALDLHVESGYGSFTLGAINQIRYTYGGVYLYTHDFNSRRSTGTNEVGYDVICSAVEGTLGIGKTLTLRVDEILPEATDTAVGEGQYVLTANLQAGEQSLAPLRALTVGDTLTVSVTAADEGWNDVEYMIGALYQLVENGEVCTGLEAGAAPRTAIGQRADGSIVLYSIDGRQAGHSIGATLTQVARRMIELGCVTALSLDGGGSTTVSVTLPEAQSASVYNLPSEGSLRAVTNHVFLVASNEPSGTLDRISLRAEGYAALAGAQVKLFATAVDTNGIPMDRSLSFAADRGSVSEDGVFTAPAGGGTATVGAKTGGKYATAKIDVLETPESIKLLSGGKAADTLRLSPGESVSLTAQAVYRHLPLIAQNSCFTWSVDGGVGTVDENGVLTAGSDVAYGSLTVRAGETALTIPVYVSADPQVLLDGFEGGQTVFAQNTDKNYVRFGAASARWDYVIEQPADGAQESVLSAEASYAVPTGYDRAALWVYGDGAGEKLSLTTDAGETDAVPIDFTGWRQLAFTLPSGTESIAGFTLHAQSALTGTLYLDQLVVSHGSVSDTTAPELHIALSEDGAALTGKVFDTVDGAKLATMRVLFDGKAINYTYDHQTGALHAALPAADGKAHHVSVIAGDASGNLARAGLDVVPQELAPAFPDTAGHSANAAVSFLKANGITNGGDGGLYNPDSSITREEFAALLFRYLAPETDYSSVKLPFDDAGEISGWAYSSVQAMYAMGVTQGSTDLKGRLCFSPKATISRAEAVTMLGRLLERGYAAPEWNFSDSGEIQDWARTHVNTLCAIGALSAYPDGGIHPADPITRAQVAELLFRMT